MKDKFRRIILSATVAIFITYYAVRMFGVLYAFVPNQVSIKSRPAVEQAHLKAEEKRLVRRHGYTTR